MAGVNYSLWVGDPGTNYLITGESLTWYQAVAVGKMRWFTAAPGITFESWTGPGGPIQGGPVAGDFDEWIEISHVQHVWRSAVESGTRQLQVYVTIYNPRTDIDDFTIYAIYLAEQDNHFPLNAAFN